MFSSAVWRKAPNGSQSIADWVYETNMTQAPVCHFKENFQTVRVGLVVGQVTTTSCHQYRYSPGILLVTSKLLIVTSVKLTLSEYVWELYQEINRIAFAQTVLIPICLFFQIVLLLRYFRLDKTMGTLLMTMRRFLSELVKLFLMMAILIIPYGLIQENFLFPNQYLTRKVSIS